MSNVYRATWRCQLKLTIFKRLGHFSTSVLLSELLSPDRIRIPLKASDKEGVLRELVQLLMATNGAGGLAAAVEDGVGGGGGHGGGGEERAAGASGGAAADEVLAAILERERQFPTGIGYGVAVPHAKTPALAALVVVAGTAPKPVSYEAIDGEPVRLFFLLAGPESQAGAHVKALSRISRLVRREPVRARLLEAQSPGQFYAVLREAEVA